MNLHNDTAEIYVPDSSQIKSAIARTTHMAIGAHQDDLEMMAAYPILECYQKKDLWFTGVVMTDGRGSPRTGQYKDFSDEKMRLVRMEEQRKAAMIGDYSALVMLDYPSAVVKSSAKRKPIEDVTKLLKTAMPETVYTHNLVDKHDTHVSVALRVIEAIRRLPMEKRPRKLYGCEVWRGLDWMMDEDKVQMDVSEHENLQMALLGVFDSQITGGKRYDLGTMGRRQANATFSESHETDTATSLVYAMDMSPLIFDESINHLDFVQNLTDRFSRDVSNRLRRLT
ncbi:MAG: PIG-L family deacetylase [Anaerolineales bacterium]